MKRHAARAFTMIELLIVIAILAVLVAFLLPVTDRKHPGPGLRVQCMSNLKELTMGWFIYSQDYNGVLTFAVGQTNAWALGNAQTVPQDTSHFGQLEPGVLDATNIHAISRGTLFPDINSFFPYRCPLDHRTVNGAPYVRSYSMNNWMNGQPSSLNFSNRVYQKNTDIPDPSQRFVFIDEDPASINNTMFTVPVDFGSDMPHVPSRAHKLGSITYHPLSFADGHVEAPKFLSPDTVSWEPPQPLPAEISHDGTTNQDLIKLRYEAYAPWPTNDLQGN